MNNNEEVKDIVKQMLILHPDRNNNPNSIDEYIKLVERYQEIKEEMNLCDQLNRITT